MKINKRFNTILFKLSASFIVIIALSVLLTGVFASISFRIYSNSQIMSANEIILNDTCEFIDKDILTKADELYLRFVLQGSENNLFSKMVQQDEIKDYREMNNMKKLLADQQVINSPVTLGGLTYPNAEAAFQAQKCEKEEDKVKYTLVKNPVVAKRMGKLH